MESPAQRAERIRAEVEARIRRSSLGAPEVAERVTRTGSATRHAIVRKSQTVEVRDRGASDT